MQAPDSDRRIQSGNAGEIHKLGHRNTRFRLHLRLRMRRGHLREKMRGPGKKSAGGARHQTEQQATGHSHCIERSSAAAADPITEPPVRRQSWAPLVGRINCRGKVSTFAVPATASDRPPAHMIEFRACCS
jgi:hypothetical protein